MHDRVAASLSNEQLLYGKIDGEKKGNTMKIQSHQAKHHPLITMQTFDFSPNRHVPLF